MDKFAIKLKEIRTEKGYTQKQLAEAIKTTDDSIYSWEKGRSQPSIEMLRALSKFFEVSTDYLLGLED
ncbi:MAG: helix-turn-helix transcriptional regulator [Clostridia bacterium]|jgi:transcriptional regulator with XRE-family HTH domain|nr:helix-turn-helix transcriptional regulator [Clostridia bacterium]